ncbi:hypothetical protein PVAP13_1NG189700 [Panicum virgatum]|uniref:Uncharacterized protein n=1 Tax=Panicum virgatum TaxID=38727 RepID=A0A8T0WKC8_PANVG|nr:hypothetical protein PVAP13_1NG189700 [Panicum virgatum]
MSLTAGSSGLFGQQDDTRSDMVKLPKNWVVYQAGDHHCSVLSRFSFSPPISFGNHEQILPPNNMSRSVFSENAKERKKTEKKNTPAMIRQCCNTCREQTEA